MKWIKCYFKYTVKWMTRTWGFRGITRENEFTSPREMAKAREKFVCVFGVYEIFYKPNFCGQKWFARPRRWPRQIATSFLSGCALFLWETMTKEYWCVGCCCAQQLCHFDRNPHNPSEAQLLYLKCYIQQLPEKFHQAYKICNKMYKKSKIGVVKVCTVRLWKTVEIR